MTDVIIRTEQSVVSSIIGIPGPRGQSENIDDLIQRIDALEEDPTTAAAVAAESTARANGDGVNAAAITAHASRNDNPHGVTKSQVGLGSVDNTSDADKPVSTATGAALATLTSAIAAETTGRQGADAAHVAASDPHTQYANAGRFATWLAPIVINAKLTPYNATGDGTTNDAAAIQAALDAAGTAGGGTVVLPVGTYKIGSCISVPANVELVGQGWGTIIRTAAGVWATRTINSAGFSCAIAMAYTGSAVRDLWLDLRTNSTATNGIQAGEDGAATRAADCEVTGCKVTGWDTHQYLIYVKKADRCRIIGNTVRGVASSVPTQDLAGIEVFGSDGSEVGSNNIANCWPGITIKTEAGVTNSGLTNIVCRDNIIDTCAAGIDVSITSGTVNASSDIIVRGNIVTNTTGRGVALNFSSGATAKNLAMSGNTIREASNGCLVIDSDAAATVTGLLINGNTVIQTGGSAAGITVTDAPGGAVLVSNQLIGTPTYGISINNANDVRVLSNTILGSQLEGIYIAGTSARCVIASNILDGYGSSSAKTGIKGDTGTSAHIIMSNFFNAHATSASAYIIDCQAATNCVITHDNVTSINTQSAVYTNGTGGRNNYGIAGYDRNSYRTAMMFPREIGIGMASTDILTDYLDVNAGTFRLRSPTTPASASASGSQGQIRWDANYLYICTATNTWKRVAVATW